MGPGFVPATFHDPPDHPQPARAVKVSERPVSYSWRRGRDSTLVGDGSPQKRLTRPFARLPRRSTKHPRHVGGNIRIRKLRTGRVDTREWQLSGRILSTADVAGLSL